MPTLNPWIDFFAVIGIQLLFFLFLAYEKKAVKKITLPLIIKSIIVGVIFGIAFDLVAGKYLGIFRYALHFDPLFLVINGGLSYGLWLLTVQLLQSERFLPFCAWTIAIGSVYEVANHFYPVWQWTFGGSFLYQESVVILAAYCGLAMLAALAASLMTQTRFRAFKLKV